MVNRKIHQHVIRTVPAAHGYDDVIGYWGGDQDRVAIVLVDCTWIAVGGEGGPWGLKGHFVHSMVQMQPCRGIAYMEEAGGQGAWSG